MTIGTPADGAPARVRAGDFATAHDHLRAIWTRLIAVTYRHDERILRLLVEPESATTLEVARAWQAASREVNEALLHLAYVTQTLQDLRAAIIAALERAAHDEEAQT